MSKPDNRQMHLFIAPSPPSPPPSVKVAATVLSKRKCPRCGTTNIAVSSRWTNTPGDTYYCNICQDDGDNFRFQVDAVPF